MFLSKKGNTSIREEYEKIIRSKITTPSLTKPIYCDSEEYIPSKAILFLNLKNFNNIVNTIKELKPIKHNRFKIFIYQDLIVVGDFGIGPSMISIVMEELIHMGVKTFISIGSSGSLTNMHSIGTYILCERATVTDGVSKHYGVYDDYIEGDRCLYYYLLNKINIPIKSATTWTIDAPYRETNKDIAFWRSQNVDCVEMEASAFYSVAKFHKVSAIACFVVSDFFTTKWQQKINSKNKTINLNIYAMELIRLLNLFKNF